MKNKNRETVCAVVVTYNRKNLLIECLEALRKQTWPIQAIYLIDNASTDGTPNLLLEKGYIKELPPKDLSEPWEKEFEIKNLTDGDAIKLYYVRMHENTGGAGGFHEGVKRGYEKGYDWLWLMDDDVGPDYICLEKLFNGKQLCKGNIAALMPVRFYINKLVNLESKKINLDDCMSPIWLDFYNDSDLKNVFFEIATIPFEGPLISSKAIYNIGLPNKDLFIFADDTDYSIRLNKVGKIYMVSNAKIYKKLLQTDTFFDWKTYYLLRNIIFLDRKYGKTLCVKYFRPILMLFLFIKKYRKFFFNRKFVYLFLAFYHGYKMKLGKTINPGHF